jgi:MraZ protein
LWGQNVFRGINTINLDTKGRMAMPSRYREQLSSSCAGQLVVTIDTNHKCLLLYPLPEWEQIERQIESLSSFDPMSQRVKHLLIGHANDLELDGSGRILLPQELRKYASLEKHVCLIGQGKKLEIWDQDSWNQQRDLWLEEKSNEGELPEKLRTLAL